MSRADFVPMMDKAYFVGRHEILAFFNDLLDLNLSKIEQTATGAIACQLTEYIFPGSIQLSRINWEARSDYEFVGNYKLLQAAFDKNNVTKYVDVNKLIRAKYQDNFEFCQWLKAWFDQTGAHREEYDAAGVRAKGKGGKKYNASMGKGSGAGGAKPKRTTRPVTSRPVASRSTARPAAAATKAPLRASENQVRPARTSAKSAAASAAQAKANEELTKKAAELETKVGELETIVGDVEKERDFYFGKLRSIELFLQIKQDQNWENCEREDVVDNLFKVLYATVDDDVVVDEEGNIIPAGEEPPEVADDSLLENEDFTEADLLAAEAGVEVDLVETEY